MEVCRLTYTCEIAKAVSMSPLATRGTADRSKVLGLLVWFFTNRSILVTQPHVITHYIVTVNRWVSITLVH
jgi:hypothetical protein